MRKRSGIVLVLTGILVLTCGSNTVNTVALAAPVGPKGLEGVGVAGTGITATLPDPKHPGKLLWIIWAKSATGNIASGKATAYGITAVMFQGGRRAAKMTASQADYNDGQKTIVASGGVSYASLAQSDKEMHARSVTYHADTGQGVARGGVRYYDRKSGAVIKTPIAYFDSSLQNVQTEPIVRGH